MSHPLKSVSEAQLKALLQKGESETIERCKSYKTPAGKTDRKIWDKLAKTISAFSNDMAGHNTFGVIFVGLKDNGEFAGLAITDEVLKDLSNLRSAGNLLPLPVISVRKLVVKDKGEVAAIVVQPSLNPPMRYKNQCYVRTGSTTRPASFEEESRLAEKRQQRPYDMQGVKGASLKKDFNQTYFTEQYLPSAVSQEVLEKNDRDPNKQMEALRLLDSSHTPTVTALLVMGINPRSWFPGAYIQFVRFEGKELTDPVQNQREVSGTLPDQIRRMEEIFTANISTSLKLTDTTHIQSSDYPFEALSQLVRNAVIHRDYKSYTPVRVHWFWDRVEIQSPGGPFGELNPGNFGVEELTSYRNPTVAEALKNLGFIERFGFGLPPVRKVLKKNGNPELELQATEGTVLAVVRKAP